MESLYDTTELTVNKLYESFSTLPSLDPELEKEYLHMLKYNTSLDPRERSKIIESIILAHQKLILLMAIKFYWNSSYKDNQNQDDLILELYSAAVLGFMYAIGKYNPESGVKLTSYAANWCRYNMQKELLNFIGETRYAHNMRKKTLSKLENQKIDDIMSKWTNYFFNNKEIMSIPMTQKQYDLIVEMRIALDSMQPQDKDFILDYYGIKNHNDSVTLKRLCDTYKTCSERAIQKKLQDCKEELKKILSDYQESVEIIDKGDKQLGLFDN